MKKIKIKKNIYIGVLSLATRGGALMGHVKAIGRCNTAHGGDRKIKFNPSVILIDNS